MDEQLRLDQEAREQESGRKRQKDQPRIEQQVHTAQEQERLEQKRRDEVVKGEQKCRELDLEMQERDIPYDELTEAIQTYLWINNYGVHSHITKVSFPAVTLRDDGTIEKNRSRVGWNISYSYDDIKEGAMLVESDGDANRYYREKFLVRATQEFTIGMGYFGKEVGPNGERSDLEGIEQGLHQNS